MFSITVEYALAAMAEIAKQPTTTASVAKAAQCPRAYLPKVLQLLRRARLITSKRGVHGGVRLAKPANKITLLDVIDAVEPLKRLSNGKTTLSRKLDGMVSTARKTAGGITLADVARGKR